MHTNYKSNMPPVDTEVVSPKIALEDTKEEVTIALTQGAPVKILTAEWPITCWIHPSFVETKPDSISISVRRHKSGVRLAYGSFHRSGAQVYNTPRVAGFFHRIIPTQYILPPTEEELDLQAAMTVARVFGVESLIIEEFAKLPVGSLPSFDNATTCP